MKEKVLSLLTSFIPFCISLSAQRGNLDISAKGINTIVNAKMESLVTGSTTGTGIASYASCDPANGRFVFKGTTSANRKKDNSFPVYVSLKLEGDLISDSYAVLFKNNALNSQVGADAQIHFRSSNNLHDYYSSSSGEAILKKNKDLLKKWQDRERATVMASHTVEGLRPIIEKNTFNASMVVYNIKANALKRQGVIDDIKNELAKASPDATRMTTLGKTLKELEKETDEYTQTQKRISYILDSLSIVSNNLSSLELAALNKLQIAYRDSLSKLELQTNLVGLKFSWYTVTLGVSKKKVYTFTDNLPIDQPIPDVTLNTVRFGLSFNYYAEQQFPSKVFYGNIGFLHYKDNNTRFLSTKQILETKTQVTTPPGTARQLSKTYNVFTNPIVEWRVTSLFHNAYFMNEAKTLGLHFFPSLDLIEREKSLFNIGAGVLTSFKNEKKDKPIVNVELYFKMSDLLNNYDQSNGLWNKNELGITFSLPFNFLN